MNDQQFVKTRRLTPEEMAACIRRLREINHWSQEQLAAISGLNVRTIQRVERGSAQPSLDTLRALANAFGSDDIDVLSKPVPIPQATAEEIAAAKAEFDNDYIVLVAHPLITGRQLADLAHGSHAQTCSSAVDLPRPAAEELALLSDYVIEYRDCAELYSEVQKIDVYDDLQGYIDNLKAMGVILRYGERDVILGPDRQPQKGTNARLLHIMAFEDGDAPDQLIAPRKVRFGL